MHSPYAHCYRYKSNASIRSILADGVKELKLALFKPEFDYVRAERLYNRQLTAETDPAER